MIASTMPDARYAPVERAIASQYSEDAEAAPAPASDLRKFVEKRAADREANRVVPLVETPLGMTPRSEYSGLTTVELMRLLHHPDAERALAARTTLQDRDRFDDANILLAFRMFHPNPLTRAETVPLLLNNSSLNPAPWLAVLADDPDAEVRYAAYSLIATSKDAHWAGPLMRRARSDSDTRIVDLGCRYENMYQR